MKMLTEFKAKLYEYTITALTKRHLSWTNPSKNTRLLQNKFHILDLSAVYFDFLRIDRNC